MTKVRLGLIGLGNIGTHHAAYLKDMDTVELAGVCDIVPEKADRFAAECGTKAYYDHRSLFDESGLEAALIAVPHYDHTPIAIEAFERGLHVMCEKPLAVHVNDARRMIDASNKAREKTPGLVFGLMFMARTYSYYRKIKEILNAGWLGRLTRVTWINTAWFRTQAYYNSGGWRATWAGEGGGILTNQCPHDLDMYQWLFGVPQRIFGHAGIGKYHDIEVEDEVTAWFEHEGGMVGHFIVTTAEAPGTSRLEIVGENGKLVYEDRKLTFFRNELSMLTLLRESPESFVHTESKREEIPLGESPENAHRQATEAFVNKILTGAGELVANGEDGIRSVAIANAIMLSSFSGKTVELPIDGDAFERKLAELVKTSRYTKPAAGGQKAQRDMQRSTSK